MVTPCYKRCGPRVIGSVRTRRCAVATSGNCHIFEIELTGALCSPIITGKSVERPAASGISNGCPMPNRPANDQSRSVGEQVGANDPPIVRSARYRGKRRIMLQNRIRPGLPNSGTLFDVSPVSQPAIDDQNAVSIGSVERVSVAPNRRGQPAGLLLQPTCPRYSNGGVISCWNRNRVSLVALRCPPGPRPPAAAGCPFRCIVPVAACHREAGVPQMAPRTPWRAPRGWHRRRPGGDGGCNYR